MDSSNDVELKRKFGFKESREDREKRLRDEKQQKWQTKLDRESLEKLQTELYSLERSTFLAPQQKERKRLVERMVSGLLKQKEIADRHDALLAAEAEDTNDGTAQAPLSETDSDDDIYGVNVADAFTGTTDVEAFVPRTVKSRRIEERQECAKDDTDDRLKAEQDLLTAMGNDDDDLDGFLDAL